MKKIRFSIFMESKTFEEEIERAIASLQRWREY